MQEAKADLLQKEHSERQDSKILQAKTNKPVLQGRLLFSVILGFELRASVLANRCLTT
jgi:hypothetical protein